MNRISLCGHLASWWNGKQRAQSRRRLRYLLDQHAVVDFDVDVDGGGGEGLEDFLQ